VHRPFDHEKLEVYRESVAFVAWLQPFMQKMPRAGAVRDQLDRASTSIVLNLAEGNGKYTSPDRCRFFDTARGSALECAAALDVLVAQGQYPESAMVPGKDRLRSIVSMLVGLIKANSDYRMHEGGE
jgi:four helix bundle protein